METKANYTIVGIFTVAVFAAAFAFVYWISRTGGGQDVADLDVIIEGSVIGLGVGSPVYFNGISVGKITDLRFDPTNPRIVISRSRVRSDLPITDSTKAVLGITGLTGIAHIEFEGGDITEKSVFEIANETGGVATVRADPSAVSNLLVTAQDIFDRTDSVLTELEGFVADARAPLTKTLENTSQLTDAVAKNTDKIESFMDSMGSLGGTLEDVSGSLKTVLGSANNLIDAVSPEDVKGIVSDARTFTGNLSKLSTDLGGVGDTISSLAATLEKTGPRIDKTFDQIDALFAAIPSQEVNRAVTGLADAGTEVAELAKNLGSTLTEADKLLGAVKSEDVQSIVADVKGFTANLNGISSELDGVGKSVSSLVSSFGTAVPRFETALDQVNELLGVIETADVQKAVSGFAVAGEEVSKAAKDVSRLTGTLDEQRDDIEKIVANAAQMAERLNAASVRVDGVLAKVDGFLGDSSADSLIDDVSETLASFRQVANTLNQRLDGITAGLERFSGRGLRDVEALVADTRRSINRIESAISSIESNPQRLLFGGEGDVKRFDGRQRR